MLKYCDAGPGAGKTEFYVEKTKRLYGKILVVICAPTHKLIESIKSRIGLGGVVIENSDERVSTQFRKAKEKSKLIFITHSALTRIHPKDFQNTVLVIDEAMQEYQVIGEVENEGNAKLYEWSKVRPANEPGIRISIRNIKKGNTILSEAIAIPTIDQYVKNAKNVYWFGACLKVNGVFILCKNSVESKEIKLKNTMQKGVIKIIRCLNEDRYLSRRKLQHSSIVTSREGQKLLIDEDIPIVAQIAKIAMNRYMRKGKTLVFTNKPIRENRGRYQYSDLYAMHHFLQLKAAATKANGELGFKKIYMHGEVDRVAVKEYNYWKNAKFDFSPETYNMHNFGLAPTSSIAGLNEYKTFTRIMFLAPLIMPNDYASWCKHIFGKEWDANLTLLGATMVQCIMRGCARAGKDMEVVVFGTSEARLLKSMLVPYGIKAKIEKEFFLEGHKWADPKKRGSTKNI